VYIGASEKRRAEDVPKYITQSHQPDFRGSRSHSSVGNSCAATTYLQNSLLFFKQSSRTSKDCDCLCEMSPATFANISTVPQETTSILTTASRHSPHSLEQSHSLNGNHRRDQVRTYYSKSQSRIKHVARVVHAPGPLHSDRNSTPTAHQGLNPLWSETIEAHHAASPLPTGGTQSCS
jgi:hypothetical protein